MDKTIKVAEKTQKKPKSLAFIYSISAYISSTWMQVIMEPTTNEELSGGVAAFSISDLNLQKGARHNVKQRIVEH